jgi:oxalate decarboxylase/phosphoglucose isomerase-like protein (cupin superfamily)
MIFHKLTEDSKSSKHGFVERPWGKFIVLDTVLDKNDMVHRQKLLVIKPNVALQLHKHTGYAELWIGESEFDYTLESDKGELITATAKPFSRVFVPKNRKHTIINNSNEELKIFELQTGIIRDDDNIKFD